VKDCSTCPHRVEINPRYKTMKFENTPCCGCEPENPDTKAVPFADHLRWVISKPYTGDQEQVESVRDVMATMCRKFSQMSSRQQKLFSFRVQDPDMSISDMARSLDISRTHVRREIDKIVELYPELDRIMRSGR